MKSEIEIQKGQYFEYEEKIYQSLYNQIVDKSPVFWYCVEEDSKDSNEKIIEKIIVEKHKVKILSKEEYPEYYV